MLGGLEHQPWDRSLILSRMLWMQPVGSSAGDPPIDRSTPVSPLAAPSPARTRLQDGIRKPKVFSDHVHYGCYTSSGEAQSVQEALMNSNQKMQCM